MPLAWLTLTLTLTLALTLTLPGLVAQLDKHLKAQHEWLVKRKALLEAREANFLNCFASLGVMAAATEDAPPASQPAKGGFHNRGSTTLNRSIGVKPQTQTQLPVNLGVTGGGGGAGAGPTGGGKRRKSARRHSSATVG